MSDPRRLNDFGIAHLVADYVVSRCRAAELHRQYKNAEAALAKQTAALAQMERELTEQARLRGGEIVVFHNGSAVRIHPGTLGEPGGITFAPLIGLPAGHEKTTNT